MPVVSERDLTPALAVLVAGAASLVASVLTARDPFHFVPAMDGLVTVGAVGFLLALAGKVPYRVALVAMLPIVGIQALGARVHHASFLATVGIEALVAGMVGVALALRAAAARPPVRAQAAPSEPRGVLPQPRPAHAH
jgi:hypothetical protein